MCDPNGNWPIWSKKWMKKFSSTVKSVASKVLKLKEDVDNFDMENEDVSKVYASNYFSAYKGALVIRHSIEPLSSWSLGQVIALKRYSNMTENEPQTRLLNHEYGHILQEREYGIKKYSLMIFVPSASYCAFSKLFPEYKENYYSMPWEYDADIRGEVNRDHAGWSDTLRTFYFTLWGEGE